MTTETNLTERGELTRARILATAADLMFAQGVARTSLDDVMAASRTSKSQMYHYFADRDALIGGVIRLQAERVLAQQRAVLEGIDSLDGLRRWRDLIVDYVRSTGGVGGCPVGSLASQLGQSDAMRELIAAGFAEWESILSCALGRMQARGALSTKADPPALATALVAAFQGGFLLAQTARSPRPVELAMNMAIDHVERQATAGTT